MQSKKTGHRLATLLQEALLRTVLFGIRIAPKAVSGQFCKIMGLVAFPFSGKERRKIARNIDKVLGIPRTSKESREFQKRVLQHQIVSSFESFKSSFAHDLVEVSGLEDLQEQFRKNLQQGRGLIITTGHMGSWELAAYYCSLCSGGKFNALAKPSKLDAATALLDEYRLRMHTKTLWTNQKSLMKKMIMTLRNGEALGFVMDQRPDGRKGPTVAFMGQPTSFVVGPAWASSRNGTPVMGVFCMREGPWKYRLIGTELLPAGHTETDTDKMTQVMATEIERIIKLYPEQWVWNYSRWKFKRD